MRKILYLALSVAFACNSSQKTTTPSKKAAAYNPVPFAETITQQELKDHLYTYASDEFEGRETGQPGQKKAVEYLKDHYEKIGVPAAKDNGDYFQKVPLEISGMPEATITLNDKSYEIGKDFVTFFAPAKNEYTVNQIVFAGYGIEDEKYSDYTDLDVTGKVIAIMVDEPKGQDGNYLISGTSEASKWSDIKISMPDRLDIAMKKGAKGMLLIDKTNFDMISQQFNFLKQRAENGRMQLKGDEGEDFFYAFISNDMATAISPELESQDKGAVIDTDFDIAFSGQSNEVNSENVVALIRGTEKPEEYVVISSHLDHIGVTEDGQINNGADDDGSGSVALLEIAQAFKKAADAGNGPKRSIVFLHVTGEEKGLLGSDYYTRNPIFPLENTVADLNIDMIGRIDPKREGDRNYVYLIGSDKLSTELHNLSEEVNKKYCQIELDYTYNDDNDPNRFYYRSDHYNFAKNNIPVIFYFNGTHDDYHRPGDTPDKINYDLLENRTRLVFYTAWEVANRENRLVVDKAAE
ncbi:M28 family peptidase [Sinomicrobium weinanense]|uniref:M28 family peptidase n=1 Tax=Sinomicrobium weinanense TaxID=2842200 RepID=A0A926JUB9_9FLAO|nr:M28 family peptidase [Sinomicrobium weinanense]MBC9797685.1 M28 family peptidase [Sinomicrobium weinanense]MBU3125802.1 M28 family peptidase [Sinomicrobium weinanense]